MTIKLIGAAMVIVGCGGFGFRIAAIQKRDEFLLRQLINVLDYLVCELQYRMPSLPQLCKQASLECSGVLSRIFLAFSKELYMQISPDAQTCMNAALSQFSEIPKNTAGVLQRLGHSFGRFDLEGQLDGLEKLRQECKNSLAAMSENRDVRLRTYQTLGLCAGAALAILFI